MFRVVAVLALAVVPAVADLSTSANCSLLGTNYGFHESTTGTSGASCNDVQNFIDQVGPVSATETASAQAGYGHLSLIATTTVSNQRDLANSSAHASFNEILTITGGIGLGFAQFSFTGQMDTCFSFTTFDGLSPNAIFGNPSNCFYGQDDLFSVTQTEQFTFGVPFGFGAYADTRSYCCNIEPVIHTDISVDLSDIAVFDSNHQPLPSFAYTTASGAVPEPSALLLLIPAVFWFVSRVGWSSFRKPSVEG